MTAIPPSALPLAISPQLRATVPFEGKPFEQFIAGEIDVADVPVDVETDAQPPERTPFKPDFIRAMSSEEAGEPVPQVNVGRLHPLADKPAEPEFVEPGKVEGDASPMVMTHVQVQTPPPIFAGTIRPGEPATAAAQPPISMAERPATAKADIAPPLAVAAGKPETPVTDAVMKEEARVAETPPVQAPDHPAVPLPVANITAEQWMTARVALRVSGAPTRPATKMDEAAVANPDSTDFQILSILPTPEATKAIGPAPIVAATPDISGSAPDAIINRQLDLASSDRWLADLSREVASFSEPHGKLIFRLSPESLGQLEVSVSRDQETVSVEIKAGSEEAQSILSSNLPRLEQELRGKLRGPVETQIWTGTNTSGQGERQSQHRPSPTITTLHNATSTDAPSNPDTPKNTGLFA